jgi:phosphate-selective porin OprO/OprP
MLLLSVPFVALARSSEADGDATTRVARLEALLEKQQQRIADLEGRVASAPADDVERARADALKQQIREVLSEKEFRDSLMPSTLAAGYDSGFYIKSTDEKFLMRFNGLMQFRWTQYATQSRNRYLLPRFERDDRSGFDLNRVRFTLSGNVYSPDLTYYLQLAGDASAAYDAGIAYAWVNYRFADEFQMKFGIFDLSSTRNTFNDDAIQHFVDRPLFDAVYSFGTGLGVRFWGQLLDKRMEYYLDVANSTSDGENTAIGRTITPDPPERDNNPAILFRAVWHALGDDPATLWADECDMACCAQPALDFGFHYAFNDDQGDVATTRLPIPLPGGPGVGGYGLTTINGTQINQFGVDTAFKWQGFSVIGEYALRLVDPRRAYRAPYTPFSLLTGEESTVAQHGAVLSAGYFLPIPGLEKKLELVARVGGISALAENQEGSWEYAAGLNYYIRGHNVKLQTDVTKIYEVPITSSYSSLANVNDDALIFRVQLQVSF